MLWAELQMSLPENIPLRYALLVKRGQAYNYQKSRVRKNSSSQWTHRTFWHACLDGGWEVISLVSEAHVCGQDSEPGIVNLTSQIQKAHSCHSQVMMSGTKST